MKNYNHKAIEKKWQSNWKKKKVYKASNDSKKKKFYSLIEFPYPSGDGLHVGHPRPYIGMDVISRKRRMEGYNVLYPIGFDAFGLPTENYAIKTGKSPEFVTKKNSDNFRKQIQSLGISFDWEREINTTDPKYYKWTQWIFLKFLEKGLAYKKKMTINWCPKDKIGLANEEVISGCCERCGTKVEKREKEQWMLAITKYAKRLDKDLDLVDFLPQIKLQQRNWIGMSDGWEIVFKIVSEKSLKNTIDLDIKVFTTRIDTIFGVTYLVLGPENEILEKLEIENREEVLEYIKKSKEKTEIERTDTKAEKTGVLLKGIKAINPANKEEIPVFIADYVLSDYGTGAIMAVPAHDERDFEFAKKYNLPKREVIIPRLIDIKNPHVKGKEIVYRNAIIAVVFNPKNNKVLTLKWKKQPWTTFVMGGVEEGEDPINSAKREIKEETGYKNLKFIKILGEAQSEFFAAHKDVNRVAHTYNILFELVSDEKEKISKEEDDIHEVIWQDLSIINKDNMTHSEMELILKRMQKDYPYLDSGIISNSNQFNRMESESAKEKIAEFVKAKKVEKYKLRDWVFSRQRYWGEPIPVIHCDKCGIVKVPEKDLPVKLPKVKNYKPTDNGESPLANIKSWVNVKCPKCKSPAKRETDTMPNWAGSSWYYLRYIDPKNNKEFVSKKAVKYWGQVDWYNGGMEHTTLHLLYSRFWHKFLYDLKFVLNPEPYKKRTSHGLILASDGEKMSKSRGNVINPDGIVKTYGADTLRVYEMFMGPFYDAIKWDTNSIIGSRRFLDRVWRIQSIVSKKKNEKLEFILNKTIKKVGDDIENMSFNTAISSLMICLGEIEKEKNIGKDQFSDFIKILSVFAPHICEEIWQNLKNKGGVVNSIWPKFNIKKIIQDKIKVVVQINGRLRNIIEVENDISEKDILNIAKGDPIINKWLLDKEIKKVIYIKGKVLNLVV